ncbi:MAG: hypothetical protein ACI8ZN_002511, partial [Bacteroidia bacterium]
QKVIYQTEHCQTVIYHTKTCQLSNTQSALRTMLEVAQWMLVRLVQEDPRF